MARVEFSCGKQMNGHIYGIGNNKQYSFIDKFEFAYVYLFIVGNTSLVNGKAFQNFKGQDEEVGKRKLERSIGVKEEKRRKEVMKEEGNKVVMPVRQSAQEMLLSIRNSKEAIERKNDGRLETEKKKL